MVKIINIQVDFTFIIPNEDVIQPGAYLSGMWLGVNLKMDIKRHWFTRDWTMCSAYANHSRFNSHRNKGGPM